MSDKPFPTREFHINIKCKVTVPSISYETPDGTKLGLRVGGNLIESKDVTTEDIDKYFSDYQAEWWYALDNLAIKGIEVEFEEAE